jgi:hypothetical protein
MKNPDYSNMLLVHLLGYKKEAREGTIILSCSGVHLTAGCIL